MSPIEWMFVSDIKKIYLLQPRKIPNTSMIAIIIQVHLGLCFIRREEQMVKLHLNPSVNPP